MFLLTFSAALGGSGEWVYESTGVRLDEASPSTTETARIDVQTPSIAAGLLTARIVTCTYFEKSRTDHYREVDVFRLHRTHYWPTAAVLLATGAATGSFAAIGGGSDNSLLWASAAGGTIVTGGVVALALHRRSDPVPTAETREVVTTTWTERVVLGGDLGDCIPLLETDVELLPADPNSLAFSAKPTIVNTGPSGDIVVPVSFGSLFAPDTEALLQDPLLRALKLDSYSTPTEMAELLMRATTTTTGLSVVTLSDGSQVAVDVGGVTLEHSDLLDHVVALGEAAFRKASRETLWATVSDAMAIVKAADAVLPPASCARLHRLIGLAHFVDHDSEDAKLSFAAARVAQPKMTLPTTLVPAAHPIRSLYWSLEPDGFPTTELPAGTYVDGERRNRHTDFPAVIQVVEEGHIVKSKYTTTHR